MPCLGDFDVLDRVPPAEAAFRSAFGFIVGEDDACDVSGGEHGRTAVTCGQVAVLEDASMGQVAVHDAVKGGTGATEGLAGEDADVMCQSSSPTTERSLPGPSSGAVPSPSPPPAIPSSRPRAKHLCPRSDALFCSPLTFRGTTRIPELAIMNLRGDVLVKQPYRLAEVLPKAIDHFYSWWSRCPEGARVPVILLNNVAYTWVQREGMLFMTYTTRNISPSFALELLQSVSQVLRDFLGELSECAIQRNRHMVYEVCTEIVEDGIPQSTDPDHLKAYVFESPVVVDDEELYRDVEKPVSWTEAAVACGSWAGKTLVNPVLSYTPIPRLAEATGVTKIAASVVGAVAGEAALGQVTANRPIVATVEGKGKQRGCQLFVDVDEEISTQWNTEGEVEKSEVVGRIRLRNFIPGNPVVEIALNNNIYALTPEQPTPPHSMGKNAVVLSNCSFHGKVHTTEWEAFRSIKIQPPEGELVVMSYRCSSNLRQPFRTYVFVGEGGAPYQFEITFKIRAQLSEQASCKAEKITLRCPLPLHASAVNFEYGTVQVSRSAPAGQKAEWDYDKRTIIWDIASMAPAGEQVLRAKVTSTNSVVDKTRMAGIGPVHLQFEVTGWSASHMFLQYVRLVGDKGFYRPEKYLRYTCRSGGYVLKTR